MTEDRAGRQIVFEPWGDAAAAEVWAALGSAWHWTAVQGRTYLGADRDGERFRRTRVLRDPDGAVAGVLAVADNGRLHPVNLNSYIEIAEHRRRSGLGAVALAELRRLAGTDDRALEARAENGSAGHRFLLANDFDEVQRTRTLRLDTALLPQPSGRAPAIEVHLTPADAPDDVVLAWQERYLATHPWNPAARLPLDQARKRFAALAAQVIVARAPGGPVEGVAFLADGEFEGCSTHPDRPSGIETVRWLLRAAAEIAGTPALVAEVDDAATATVAAVSTLTVAVEDDTRIAVSLPIADLR